MNFLFFLIANYNEDAPLFKRLLLILGQISFLGSPN
jgi:hypothetical protein